MPNFAQGEAFFYEFASQRSRNQRKNSKSRSLSKSGSNNHSRLLPPCCFDRWQGDSFDESSASDQRRQMDRQPRTHKPAIDVEVDKWVKNSAKACFP